jgi:3-methyladenine DNA glycosylase/8-oxoguanine DNA glycosylase
VEQTLRELGFGYRAKYIYQTACMIANDRPKGFLTTLREEKDYREAHDALLEFSGVGPKVADCVCLMSLDKMGAVPVDTHGMFNIYPNSLKEHTNRRAADPFVLYSMANCDTGLQVW